VVAVSFLHETTKIHLIRIYPRCHHLLHHRIHHLRGHLWHAWHIHPVHPSLRSSYALPSNRNLLLTHLLPYLRLPSRCTQWHPTAKHHLKFCTLHFLRHKRISHIFLLQTISCPCKLVETIIKKIALIHACPSPGFVVFGKVGVEVEFRDRLSARGINGVVGSDVESGGVDFGV